MQKVQSYPRNPNRAIREKFRKRRCNLMKKADELAYMCQADVYLVMYRGDKFYSYSSTDREEWPPSEEEMAGHYPLREHSGPDDIRTIRRSTTQRDDGELSEQSDDLAIPDPQPRFVPLQPIQYPKRTLCLPRPPQLSLVEDVQPDQTRPARDRIEQHTSHRPEELNGVLSHRKTFVLPKLPQLQVFQSNHPINPSSHPQQPANQHTAT